MQRSLGRLGFSFFTLRKELDHVTFFRSFVRGAGFASLGQAAHAYSVIDFGHSVFSIGSRESEVFELRSGRISSVRRRPATSGRRIHRGAESKNLRKRGR